MRLDFFEALHKEMSINEDIYFLTADLGYGLADKIFEDFPERALNTRAAEQIMLGTAIGLTLQGKIAICYSITPFLLLRPAEWIKLYLEHEKTPVKLVASGRKDDYLHDGISHYGLENPFSILNKFPEHFNNMEDCLKEVLYNDKPTFLSLKR